MTDMGIKCQRNDQSTRGKRLTFDNREIDLSLNAPFQIPADFSFRSAGVAVR